MELFFDTETTELCLHKESHTSPNQPHVIQIAAILSDEEKIYAQFCAVLDPSDLTTQWEVSEGAANVHGISKSVIEGVGISSRSAYSTFMQLARKAETIVCHNVPFDSKLVQAALHRLNQTEAVEYLRNLPAFCTMNKSTNLCKLPGKYGYKWPKLSELHNFLFGTDFEGAHDALEDVKATRRCYYELKRRGL